MSADTAGRARHDLLTVSPAAWAVVAATRAPLPPLSPGTIALVARWGEAGWPVIARRPVAGDPPGSVPVGLPLPPFAGKARVCLAIPAHVELRPRPGVALAVARSTAPAEWQATVDASLALGAALGLVPRVYGATLWQSLTGLAYLHAASDLDLLWPVADHAAIGPLLDGLARLDATAPMRIDGEVLTSRGGMNWRELAAARRGEAEIVLIKSLDRARFIRYADLVAEAVLCT